MLAVGRANKAWNGRARSVLFQVLGESESSLSTRPPLKQTLDETYVLLVARSQ